MHTQLTATLSTQIAIPVSSAHPGPWSRPSWCVDELKAKQHPKQTPLQQPPPARQIQAPWQISASVRESPAEMLPPGSCFRLVWSKSCFAHDHVLVQICTLLKEQAEHATCGKLLYEFRRFCTISSFQLALARCLLWTWGLMTWVSQL